jgi:hypothetical protein
MVNSTQNYWVLGLTPSSGFLGIRNTTFQKLDLFPSSSKMQGKHLLSWAP